MNTTARKQYAQILGSAVFAHIIRKQQRLVALGLYSNDERDDIIQELALTCLKALEKHYKPIADAERSTYLITCINCRSKTMAVQRVREKAHLILAGDLPKRRQEETADDLIDETPEREDQSPTPSARLDMDEILKRLPMLDRDIVQSITQGESPTAACRHKGRCNSYFIRTVRPLLKRIFKKLNA